jgi:hypothetical protein
MQDGQVYSTCARIGLNRRSRWHNGMLNWAISSVVVVVDAGHMQDVNAGQLRDCIAMCALAQIRENPNPRDVPTILSLFTDTPADRPHCP